MWMPPDQFVSYPGNDAGNVESTCFAGDISVKQHLKEEIAQLLLEFCGVAPLDGVENLVSFLNEIAAKCLVSLLAIPRTAAGCPESRLDRDQFLKEFSDAR